VGGCVGGRRGNVVGGVPLRWLDDRRWLTAAIELSKCCPPVERAYAGRQRVIVGGGRGAAGVRLLPGETDELVHAEESALAKLAGSGIDLSGATIYSTFGALLGGRGPPDPRTCTQLILDAGIGRVVAGLARAIPVRG